MKYILLLLLLATATINAQNNPYAIREAIAASIEDVNVPPLDVFKVVNKEISSEDFSIPVRVYYPTDAEALPILYHIHGGAWIAGNLETHDNSCRRLALETNSIVIAIDYRRPPEHPYPVALEDSFFILQWIHENTTALKGDGRLFLLGDSAGGGLVASLCFKNLASETPIKIDGQILINPAADLRDASATYKRYKFYIDYYVPAGIDKSTTSISPLASDAFGSLPKSIVVVSENDAIKGDGELFHQKMIASGNSSTLFEVKEIGHLAGLWAGNSEKANPAFEFVVTEFKKWTKE